MAKNEDKAEAGALNPAADKAAASSDAEGAPERRPTSRYFANPDGRVFHWTRELEKAAATGDIRLELLSDEEALEYEDTHAKKKTVVQA